MFRVLGIPFSRTDTPFFGCVVIGSVTAVVATLGDVTRLLKIAATSRFESYFIGFTVSSIKVFNWEGATSYKINLKQIYFFLQWTSTL